ncbi:stage II sporulation protein M [Staphylococcus sp. 23_2_20_HW]|uniref:stage II sporulation protein M n=1 Tax=Staphylococcus lloydii TaxID=2781774 RepID=UPI0018A06129|nr:stage II sporulation protein M [Staphylococcus lloydii]MBF7027446.1 stage II sporulation protein M [Staphylococcus lloydii]
MTIEKGFISRTLKIFLFSIGIMILTVAITYSIDINMKEVIKSIDNGIPGSVKSSSGLERVFEYIVNNGIVVPLQMFILSLIPIQFLYLFNLIYSSILPGIVMGIAIKINVYKAIIIIVPILPHTTLEILGFCIFASALYQFNKSIRIKISDIFKKDSIKSFYIVC